VYTVSTVVYINVKYKIKINILRYRSAFVEENRHPSKKPNK